MRDSIPPNLRAALVSAIVLLIASFSLAACGDSSSGSSSSSSTSSSTASAATSATTPAPSSPATAKSPSDADTSRKRAAFNRALIKFAACLRKHGIDIPPPDTSGKGPLFNTKGLNTSSPKFTAARDKCLGVLRNAAKASPPAGSGSR
ncbi:MAG TPA: hypothetical protein VFY36_06900 [Solirubrobacteraceae bacterium]|nr:hypothetical protein [Solirubrobacteraceae bacterium]